MWNECESVIDLQILIKVLIAFDWFGSARVRREMSPLRTTGVISRDNIFVVRIL